MSEYAVLFPADNEAAWRAGTESDHQATYDTDAEFAQRLRAHGGAITGGAGLADSSQARTLRLGPESQVLLTDGPYSESDQQLSGFFLVTCDDYDLLVEAAQVLTQAHPVVEIRPVDPE